MPMPRRAAPRIPSRLLLPAAVLALLVCGTARAEGGARILRLRHFSGPEHTRIVLDLDRACSFEVRRVEGPDRIALNLPGAVFADGGDRAVGDGLVERIRCNVGEGRAQVVVDLAGRREFRAFSLPPTGGKPDRVVIDILRNGTAAPLLAEAAAAPPATAAGAAATGPVDGTSAASPAPGAADMPLPAATVSGASAPGDVALASAARVVPLIEEGHEGEADPAAAAVAPGAPGAGPPAPAEAATPAAVAAAEPAAGTVEEPATRPVPADEEPFVVIIDPGHGGDDPGAIRGSLQEKDLVLDISREMARQLEKLPGYRVVLTRDRDRFLPLGKRVEIARREKGDVFVSVHCNTHPRPAVSGMEVYFLSLQGATDREARELADKENAAGLVGLPPGEEHADLVVDILMDLKMTRVLQDSGRLAAAVLTAADRSGVVAGRRVKQAGFQVLKNLAMPSALVEVAYLSNQGDYRLLGDAGGRKRLASAIVAGIQDWRAGTAPSRGRPTAIAAGKQTSDRWDTVYRVRSGDSLWKLADRYGTTMNEIARRNNLSERQRELRIGQRLRLPGAGARP